MYSDIVCYTTLICDSSLLCLDWRDICDGIQHCMFGYDEENCDKLEFNECDDRLCPRSQWLCGDGQCIPDRLEFQRESLRPHCSSLCEQYYMCDLHFSVSQWTLLNGKCYSSSYGLERMSVFHKMCSFTRSRNQLSLQKRSSLSTSIEESMLFVKDLLSQWCDHCPLHFHSLR